MINMQRDAAKRLLERWDNFNAGSANYGEAYNNLAKYAHDDWEALRAALSVAEPIGFLIPRGDVAGPDNEYYSFCEDQGSAAAEADIYEKGYFPIYASATALTAQVQDVSSPNAELIRMVDIAEYRLTAIHKALHPEMHGISGIESPEDHVAYMVGVLQSAYDGVPTSPAKQDKP